ncbi:MAG: fasciclin domain-containing protein [Bacteroidaceae bacterium]|nr:fasciclin domain-containing protein [Bacteroidaceae bacterium]
MKHLKSKPIAMLALLVMVLCGCKEHIDDEARYTFVGHTIASYLQENEEVYSSFIEILTRGECFSLMKAYGEYTCFAPTNDAIARYLREQDSIYWATLALGDPVWTGITSPELSELSDSMCKVISQTHILADIYLTTDMEGDIIPTMNMNDRYLSLGYGVDERDMAVLLINGTSKIIAKDEEVENGVVHTLASVLNPSTNMVPTQVKEHEYFRIFSEALELTGYDEMMQLYKDDTYTDGDKQHLDIKLQGYCPYPADRYYGFTAFVESDQVFNKYGVFTLEDLIDKSAEWYPNADPTAPYTSKENPLNQFVGYHLLNKKVPYSRLTCYKIALNNFDSEKNLVNYSDRNEFYETMNNKLMKVSVPRSNPKYQSTCLINYAREGANLPEMEEHVNIMVYDPANFRALDTMYTDFAPEALNGSINVIDKVLIYNEDEMAGNVLNCIIRFDASTLCPELTNNDIRWRSRDKAGKNAGEIYIPNNYCTNMEVYSEETMHFYLCPYTGWHNYQGDEMMTLGALDFAYKLPPVPAGTYEIRMGYQAESVRHIIQFYVDGEVAGIPVDLRISASNPAIGWIRDSETDDNGVANDKEMKNRGYLKAPTTYKYNGSVIVREEAPTIRKVITTKYLSEGEHWIRFKSVFEGDDGKAQFMHDYFEIVPMTFLRNESLSLDEKRK